MKEYKIWLKGYQSPKGVTEEEYNTAYNVLCASKGCFNIETWYEGELTIKTYPWTSISHLIQRKV